MRNIVTLFKNYIIERRRNLIGKTGPTKATLAIYVVTPLNTKRFANDSQFDVLCVHKGSLNGVTIKIIKIT